LVGQVACANVKVDAGKAEATAACSKVRRLKDVGFIFVSLG
jgi:hypothetical protein